MLFLEIKTQVAGHTVNAIFGNKDPKKVQLRGEVQPAAT
jgi:hypothetical protein